MTGGRRQEPKVRIQTRFVHKNTKGAGDMIDLTPDVTRVLKTTGMLEGRMGIFVIGSTAGITTIEYEPGLVKDFMDFYQKIIPRGPRYAHDDTWGDANGFSHLRASLQGPSVSIPFFDGGLLLGTWQQVVLAEFDDRPRNRKIAVQCIGV